MYPLSLCKPAFVVASNQFPTLRLSSDVDSSFVHPSLDNGQPIYAHQRRHQIPALMARSKKTAPMSTGGKCSRLSKSSLSYRVSGKPPRKQPAAKLSAARKTAASLPLRRAPRRQLAAKSSAARKIVVCPLVVSQSSATDWNSTSARHRLVPRPQQASSRMPILPPFMPNV
jgi:hypothetical protein